MTSDAYLIRGLTAEVGRLRHALAQIAEQGERLWSDFEEPQNNVPEFCRAILAGERVSLADVQQRW